MANFLHNRFLLLIDVIRNWNLYDSLYNLLLNGHRNWFDLVDRNIVSYRNIFCYRNHPFPHYVLVAITLALQH